MRSASINKHPVIFPSVKGLIASCNYVVSVINIVIVIFGKQFAACALKRNITPERMRNSVRLLRSYDKQTYINAIKT